MGRGQGECPPHFLEPYPSSRKVLLWTEGLCYEECLGVSNKGYSSLPQPGPGGAFSRSSLCDPDWEFLEVMKVFANPSSPLPPTTARWSLQKLPALILVHSHPPEVFPNCHLNALTSLWLQRLLFQASRSGL